jgi:hypothetical protein
MGKWISNLFLLSKPQPSTPPLPIIATQWLNAPSLFDIYNSWIAESNTNVALLAIGTEIQIFQPHQLIASTSSSTPLHPIFSGQITSLANKNPEIVAF